jgi:hypothetical protein
MIVAAGAPTLVQTCATLTGSSDAWFRFTGEINAHFPAGSAAGLETDDPFPLGLAGPR